MDNACLFCRIVQGEIPAEILFQDDRVTAFRDINPQAPVHILVIPNRHSASLADMSGADGPTLGRMVEVLNRLAQQEGIAKSGFRVLINTGPDAHQEVHHTHWHLLGGRQLGPMLAS